MAQLLSYLFEEGFLEERGRPVRGEVFFEDKGCAQCHQPGRAGVLRERSYTVMDVTAGMWQHGPQVREALEEQGMSWPALSPTEIADIVAWLNAR